MSIDVETNTIIGITIGIFIGIGIVSIDVETNTIIGITIGIFIGIGIVSIDVELIQLVV